MKKEATERARGCLRTKTIYGEDSLYSWGTFLTHTPSYQCHKFQKILLLLLMPSSPERSCQHARAIRRGEGAPEKVQVR